MAVNPTVLLTFFLLVLMMGAGLISGAWGYSLGRQALRGITQPDGSPSRQIGRADASSEASEEKSMSFINEADLIEAVKARMDGNAEPKPAEASPSPVSGVPTNAPEATAVVNRSDAPLSDVSAEAIASSSEQLDSVSNGEESEPTWESGAEMPVEASVDPQADPFLDTEPFLEPETDSAAFP